MNIKIGKNGKLDIIPIISTDKNDDKLLNYLIENEIFQPKLNSLYHSVNTDDTDRLYLGLGNEEELNLNKLRKAFFDAGKELNKQKYNSINISLPELEKIDFFNSITAALEGILHSQYSFDKYISDKEKKYLSNIYINTTKDKNLVNNAINEAVILSESINITRDLTNTRAIDMYPETLAKKAIEILEPLGVNVKILGKKEIRALEMDAFLAVTEGSSKDPKFIIMEYNGDNSSDEVTALVGKGITYDTGGYTLKSNQGMLTMFCDMAGSATVIGALNAIAKSKLKANIVGIVAACENMISGNSYKPGDIIGSMSGKTIEILSTDAEGRLTLADAVYYAAKNVKADRIIDIATLTGACIAAIGTETTGAVSNNNKFMKEVINASEKAGEPIWEFPSGEIYRKNIKSDFADLKNSGAPGAICAGLFIEEFVEDVPWVHLDIAGTAYSNNPSGYFPKGATGVHVKTLYNLFK